MIFGTAKRIAKIEDRFQVHYRNEPINHVCSYSYLGNILDPSLSLNNDFASKYKKSCAATETYVQIKNTPRRQCSSEDLHDDDNANNDILQPATRESHCNQIKAAFFHLQASSKHHQQ